MVLRIGGVMASASYQISFGSMDEDISKLLEKRLGRVHAKLRLGIEAEHEAQVFGQGINFFHIENLRSSHLLIPIVLKLAGLYRARLQKCGADPDQTQLRQID